MKWARMPARIIVFVSAALTLAGCTVGTPVRIVAGPKDGMGTNTSGPRIVAVTEFTLGRDDRLRAQFWERVWAVEATMKAQPGLVAYALRRELIGDKAWTMTVWEDERAIRNFVASPVHSDAMAKSGPTAVSMRFARFSIAPDAPIPDWDTALAKLESDGRPYVLN